LTFYWLPPARWNGFPSWNLVLPVITLSAIYMSYIARLTRSGMLEVLRADYVRTARAKGLSERDVILRHTLRGGLMPVVSFTGPALAFLITGTVVVERIFALPGLGNYFINANLNRDEPLIIGIVAFVSITILLLIYWLTSPTLTLTRAFVTDFMKDERATTDAERGIEQGTEPALTNLGTTPQPAVHSRAGDIIHTSPELAVGEADIRADEYGAHEFVAGTSLWKDAWRRLLKINWLSSA
jgi:hypothetical protein